MSCRIILPDTRPGDDDCGMGRLQADLLLWAEDLFGERDTSWSICPPEVVGGIPCTFFFDHPTIRLVRINLGDGANENWNIALYQMAHEVIHLLNPRRGCKANNLEEGVATAFSFYVLRKCGIPVSKFKSSIHPPYERAHKLLRKLLSGDDIAAAKRIRQKMPAGSSFSSVTSVSLMRIFPEIQTEHADELTSTFCRNKTEFP